MNIIRPKVEDIIKDGVKNEARLSVTEGAMYIIAIVMALGVAFDLLTEVDLPWQGYIGGTAVEAVLFFLARGMLKRDGDLADEMVGHELSEGARPVN